ncbi:hypothetical protein BDY19DRAFT_1057624 [Irpex rosettiformis]|uniref:Uncharacterized protein n=1 Tax=Irpex rosettiformis TaxID=378272 RepID=A0ACB8U0U8_9APHY|nr:hypothetical protein BDY19DRAFT_1057624 [Irpex rosettiformis]
MLVIARIVLYTVFKILLVPVVWSVLDMCSAEALSTGHPLPHALSNTVSPHLERLLSAIEPYISSPPIRYCVLGRDINCGLQPGGHLTDFSDLDALLVCQFINTVWLYSISLADTLSTAFKSWGAFGCSLTFVSSCSLIVPAHSVTPQPDNQCAIVASANNRLALLRDRLLDCFRWVRKHSRAITVVLCMWVDDWEDFLDVWLIIERCLEAKTGKTSWTCG